MTYRPELFDAFLPYATPEMANVIREIKHHLTEGPKAAEEGRMQDAADHFLALAGLKVLLEKAKAE